MDSLAQSEFYSVILQRRKRHTIIAVLLLTILAMLFWMLLSFIHLRIMEVEKTEDNVKILSEVLSEFQSTYDTLVASADSHEVCSATHIEKMRNEVFAGQYIKDIGYLTDGIVICSTMRGAIPKTQQIRAPDISDDHGQHFWLNENVSSITNDYVGFLINRPPYLITLNPKLLRIDALREKNLEIIYQYADQTVHIAGSKELSDKYNKNFFKSWFVKQCSSIDSYCIIYDIPIANVLPSQLFGYTTLFLFLASGGLIGYFGILFLYRWYYSTKSRISRGFDNDNFFVLYQPVVETSSRKIVGCEILARFSDDYGDIYPDQFISIIRELDKTWEFTDIVIKKGISGVESLSVLERFGVNINLFPYDVNTNAIKMIDGHPLLNKSNLNITFEITEEEYTMKNSSQSNLDVIKSNGYSLALDDFGTGYSNLEQFYELGFDTLKIDRKFVTGIESSATLYSLAKYIVSFAHNFNLKVVAEGVENEAQYELLKDLKVEYCQGWNFGKPMSIHRLQSLITLQEESDMKEANDD